MPVVLQIRSPPQITLRSHLLQRRFLQSHPSVRFLPPPSLLPGIRALPLIPLLLPQWHRPSYHIPHLLIQQCLRHRLFPYVIIATCFSVWFDCMFLLVLCSSPFLSSFWRLNHELVFCFVFCAYLAGFGRQYIHIGTSRALRRV